MPLVLRDSIVVMKFEMELDRLALCVNLPWEKYEIYAHLI